MAVKDIRVTEAPVNTPLFGGNEKKYLLECIETGWVSSEGPFVKRFERSFAERMDRKEGIAVSSGSAALDTAVAALEIGPGDEVIMPTFTIISCAAAVVRAGATPVLVDCEGDTWNMDAGAIEQKITSRTKAIMVVHIYGLPVDMEPVEALASRYGLKIIEDAAEAHGQICGGRVCGSFGDVSIFSFYPNKLTTTGEGGMVLADDAYIADRCRSLRDLCFQPERRFVHEELGFNFRMTNMQAAIGLAQLEQLDSFVERKRRMGKRYTEMLRGVEGIDLPLEETTYARNIYWVYGIVLKESTGLTASEVMRRLGKMRVGSRPFFQPMHSQPVFEKMGFFKNESYPVAERLARQGFYIPSGLGLSDEQMDYVVESIKKAIVK